jgi:hypothetical protein
MKATNTGSRQASQTRDEHSRSNDEGAHDLQDALDSVGSALTEYSKKHPTAVAVAVFFAGFYVGWKVKPW